MKEFKEFRNYFVEHHSKEIAAKSAEIANAEILKSANGKKKLDTSELAVAITAGITAGTTSMFFNVLEQYHKWVNDEKA